MKHASLLLTAAVLSSFVIVACSATGTRNESSDGSGATNVGGEGGSGLGSSGTGATGNMGVSSSGGLSTSASSSSASSSGTGGIEVGYWPIPIPPAQPPLTGDGSTGVIIGPGADPSAPNKFGGANDPNAKPTIVYPPDGVVVPPNMKSIEIHFIPAPGQTLFEIKFQAPTKGLAIYTTCTPVGGGCVFQSDASFWTGLVEYARGTAPVTYTIRGVNGNSPGSVGTSATAKMAFGQNDITGGIYYWNDIGTIQRYDFGIPNVPAKLYMTKVNAGAGFCVGCHAMSRQGNLILVGKDIPAPAPYVLFDVATKKAMQVNGQPYTGSANFFSFSPNEQYFLQSNGANIGMRSVFDGTFVVAKVVDSGTMPDWSPNGIHMVYAKPQSPAFVAVPGVSSASLETMQWNGATWTPATTLVPFAGQNNYYPTYSPTGDWVLFNRSPSNSESFSNASVDMNTGKQPDGELWAVPAQGGTPIRLSTASNPGALSWPKWAPVMNDYYGGKILWATFSSARPYGLRLAAGQKTQIWMMGFDLQKAAAGQDPSLPAFWFPYQSTTSGNHIAQWATTVARQPCASDGECSAGEFCKNGICQPVP